jgi:hypothetical protein
MGSLKEGKGLYTTANGDKYDGQWANDRPNGQGTYTAADGTKLTGAWKNSRFIPPPAK